MGIFGDARREFIARPDAHKQEIVYKWPDKNIRKFSQLTVAQDEVAVFARDGKIQGTVPNGRVTLDSSELPILGDLLDLATGGNMFLTELYFVTMREIPDLPFGGLVDNVVDPQTDLAVSLRVFGSYSLLVVDPTVLLLNLVGTRNLSSNEQISGWAKQLLLKAVRTATVTLLTQQQWQVLGIAAHTEAIETETLKNANAELKAYGISITRLGNTNVSISDDDQITLKNFRRDASYTKLAGGFTQYGAGAALRGIGEGAAHGNGNSSETLLGLGIGLNSVLGAANIPVSAKPPSAATPATATAFCTNCGAPAAENAKFCGSCGTALH